MFTRDELMAAAGTKPVGGLLPMRFAGGAIDSRQVQRGELFIALRGAHTDGHKYIPAAINAGASAILCSQPHPEATARGIPQVVVNDPLDALHRLASRHLQRQPYTKVIAVTGSNGKTGVKEATGALLRRLAPTLKTEGNLNTETGVPLTLLRLRPEHKFAVIEMGAQWVGEIAGLCRIAPPSIAVVTVVGPEHLEFFGSLENVVEAEGEAVAALPSDGIAILNDDDRDVRDMVKRTAARVVTYGRRPNATVCARHVMGDPLRGLRFTITYGGRHEPVALNIPGEHAVTTALAAASVALSCGMSLQLAAAGLSELRSFKRRGEIKPGINGATLVDDTYNANRQSAEASIALLKGAQVPSGGRRWFVFGDMLELGKYSREEHAAVGKAAAAAAVDELVLVGAEVKATADAALKAGLPASRVHLFAAPLANAEALAKARHEAAELVRGAVKEGDVVLVKASNGVGLDAVVKDLQVRRGGRTSSDLAARIRQLTASRRTAG